MDSLCVMQGLRKLKTAHLTWPITCALLLLTAGCGPHSSQVSAENPNSQSVPVFKAPGSDPWKLTWTDPKTASPALLWNAGLGIRIGPGGNAFDKDGHHLPMFWDSDYEPSGQERLQPTPSPFTVAFSVGGSPLDPMKATDWQQTLDMSNGLVETSWTDQSHGSPVRTITTSAIDPTKPEVGQQWIVTPSADAKIDVNFDFRDVGPAPINQSGSEITWSADHKKAEVRYSCNLAPDFFKGVSVAGGRPVTVSVPAGKSLILSSTVNLAHSDNTIKIVEAIDPEVINSSFAPEHIKYMQVDPNPTFGKVVQASTRARAGENQPDIEIEGPIEDQQAIRSFIYYLRSGVGPNLVGSISPFGMSNDLYDGHVFWDADIWVFPSMALIDPAEAKAIPQYRFDKMNAAGSNYASWYLAGGPTANPKLKVSPKRILRGYIAGLKFPWESSVTGKETTKGPSQFEDHITGSVAFAYSLAASLGLAPDDRGQVLVGAGQFYDDRSSKEPNGKADIKAVMSPDENHIGDNDLYTNLVAQWCDNGGGWDRDPSRVVFSDIRPAVDYNLPKDKTSFLTYDNDPVKSYKQAAAILAIYPLQYPPAEAEAKTMMDRFAGKVIPNGPAMSDSIDAIIWARIGESDKAYDAWRHGWMDFVRPPFLLFSEKRNQDRTYFTTGASGELQSVIYGFLGFRIDSKPEAGASWSLKLKGDRWLSIKPNLPKAWKRVTFRNFHVLGKTYTLTATHQSAQVTQGD